MAVRVESGAECRAWIGSLAAYNAGRLVGVWVDLDGKDEEEATAEAIAAMRPQVAGSMDEADAFGELHVFDHEGIGLLVTGECSIGEAVRAAGIIGQVEEGEREAFAAYVRDIGREHVDEDTLEAFRNAFLGEYESLEDFAREYVDYVGLLDRVPDAVRTYFDYAAFGRDLRLGGDIWTEEIGGRVLVFATR